MLAGGLNPENVGEAIMRVRPWGVDVSTGVEATPGRKDARKVKRFVEAAKEAGDAVIDDDRPPSRSDGPYDWEIAEFDDLEAGRIVDR